MATDQTNAHETDYWEIHDGGRRRFYEIRLEAEAAGRWRVVRRWGFLGCRGWRLVHRHEDRATAEREFAAVGRRRERQGYAPARSEDGIPSEGKQLLMVYPEAG